MLLNKRSVADTFTDVISISGAKIEKLNYYAESHFVHRQFDMIYFFAGVNNLSTKHKSGKISPTFQETANLVEVMFDKFVEAKRVLQRYCTKVVICQLVGLKFDKYNNSNSFPNEQIVIDEGIPLLNHSINILNHETMVKSPYIMSTIHVIRKHKRSTKYGLLPDGIHPSEDLELLWVQLILKSLEPNIRNINSPKAPIQLRRT